MYGAKQTVLTIAVLLVVTTGLQAQSQIPWVKTWQEASVLAQRNHRLVLVHFWSNNCPPCHKLERTVFNRPEMIRSIAANYVPLRVNVDEQPDFARHFGIQRWPTDLILTADGKEVHRGACPQDMNRYIATLDQVASHTRVGMPFSGSPSTDIAAGPGNVGDASRASAFPVYPAGSATTPNSNMFQLPAAAAGQPARGFPNPQPPQGPLGQPRSARAPEQPKSVVNNPYAAGPAPTDSAQERQASFNSDGGGEFQLPGQVVQRQPAARQPRTPVVAQQATTPSPSRQQQNPYAGGSPGGLGSPAASVAFNKQPQDLPVRPSVTEAPSGPPTLAVDGYCCVKLVEQEKWVKGDPQWGAVHRGQTYLFSGPEEQRRFMADFDKYAPALSGFDCVKYAERGALVPGKRAHGIFFRGQIFLFADEAALQQFWNSPDTFVPLVKAEQDRHAARQSR